MLDSCSSALPGVASVGGDLALDDMSDDETKPLVDAPVTAEAPMPTATWSQVWTILGSMRWVLFLAVFNTALMRAQNVVYFPYLRSLQHCDVPVVAAAINTGEWSGSNSCGDRALVAREAQAQVGFARAASDVAHCVSMPFLGRLGDRCGRRVLVLVHFVGVLLECALNAAFPGVRVFVAGCALRGLLSGLQPAQQAAQRAPRDEDAHTGECRVERALEQHADKVHEHKDAPAAAVAQPAKKGHGHAVCYVGRGAGEAHLRLCLARHEGSVAARVGAAPLARVYRSSDHGHVAVLQGAQVRKVDDVLCAHERRVEHRQEEHPPHRTEDGPDLRPGGGWHRCLGGDRCIDERLRLVVAHVVQGQIAADRGHAGQRARAGVEHGRPTMYPAGRRRALAREIGGATTVGTRNQRIVR